MWLWVCCFNLMSCKIMSVTQVVTLTKVGVWQVSDIQNGPRSLPLYRLKKKIVIVNIYWERLPNSFLFTVHWTLTMLKCEWCNSTNFIEVTKLRHRWSGLPKFTDLVRRNPNSESESRGCTPKQSVVYNSNFKYSAPRSIMACFCFFIWKIWPVTDRIYGIMIFWREGRGRGKLWWSVSSVQKLKRRSRETLYWLTNTSEVGHRLHFGILVPANSICAVYIKGLFI